MLATANVKASCFIIQIEKSRKTYIVIPLSVTLASLNENSAVDGQMILLVTMFFIVHCTVCEYPLLLLLSLSLTLSLPPPQ